MKKLLNIIMLALLTIGLSGGAFAAEKGSPDEAIALVKKAIAYVKANGREKAVAEFNNPTGQFKDRDLYLVVHDTKGINLANGANPKLAGKNLIDLRDAEGKMIVKSFIEVATSTKGSGWVDYKWPNPVTKAVEAKTTYIEKVEDMVIGCGVYKS
jgi:cytochrome c